MAAKYRKIDPRIWHDEKFIGLNQLEKLLAVYILCSPQSNRVGLFVFSIGKAIDDLGPPPEGVTQGVYQRVLDAFKRVVETLGWRWDPAAKVLFLPTWWKYNHPEGLNNLKGCLSDLVDLPKTYLLKEFRENLTHLGPDFHETLREGCGTPPEGVGQPLGNSGAGAGAGAGTGINHGAHQKNGAQARMTNPTLEEVQAYCLYRGKGVDPQMWFDHYTANGWKVGKNPMRDWRAAVRTWEKNGYGAGANGQAASKGPRVLSDEEIEALNHRGAS